MKAKNFIRQKKQNKKITESQFGVILEDIQDKFETVIEGHTAIDKKIDNIGGELHEFKKETNEKFGVVFEFMDETRANFKGIFEYLSRIDEELQSIRDEIKELRLFFEKKAEKVSGQPLLKQ